MCVKINDDELFYNAFPFENAYMILFLDILLDVVRTYYCVARVTCLVHLIYVSCLIGLSSCFKRSQAFLTSYSMVCVHAIFRAFPLRMCMPTNSTINTAIMSYTEPLTHTRQDCPQHCYITMRYHRVTRVYVFPNFKKKNFKVNNYQCINVLHARVLSRC